MDLRQSSSSSSDDQVMMPPCPSPYFMGIDSPLSFHLHHRSHAHAHHPHNVGIETRPVMERLRFAVAPTSVFKGDGGRNDGDNKTNEEYYWRYYNDNEDEDEDEEEENDDEDEGEEEDDEDECECEYEEEEEDNRALSSCTMSAVSQSFPMIGQGNVAPSSSSTSSTSSTSPSNSRLRQRSKSRSRLRSRTRTRSRTVSHERQCDAVQHQQGQHKLAGMITECMSAPPPRGRVGQPILSTSRHTTTTVTMMELDGRRQVSRRRGQEIKYGREGQERPFMYVPSKPIVIPERPSQPACSSADLQMRHRQLRDLLTRKQKNKAGCSVDEEIHLLGYSGSNAMTSPSDSSSSESD